MLAVKRQQKSSSWQATWAIIAIAALFATSLVAFVGTQKSWAEPADTPDLSFVGTNTADRAPYDGAFDAAGNLWVTDNKSTSGGSFLYSYNKDLVLDNSGPPPNDQNPALSKTLLAGGAAGGIFGFGATSLSFDAGKENVWVSTESQGLWKFTADQLAAGGNQTPICTISGATSTLGDPNSPNDNTKAYQIAVHPNNPDIVFVATRDDVSTDINGNNVVRIFDTSACNTTVGQTENLNINSVAYSIAVQPAGPQDTPDKPWGLVLDPDSAWTGATTFWVSTAGGSLQRFTADNIAAETPTGPGVNIELTPDKYFVGGATTIDEPRGIAIDTQSVSTNREVYVTNANPNTVTVFGANQSDGDTAPLRTIGTFAPGATFPNAPSYLFNPSGVWFDPQNRLWVANPDVVESDSAVRRYDTYVPPVPPPPDPPAPPVNPVNPVNPVTPTPTPTVTPAPAQPDLIVKARKAGKKIKYMKKTKIVKWEGTDGELTKIKAKCFLKGKRLKGKAERINCDIRKKKSTGRESTAGSKAIIVTPSCTVGLRYKAVVVAQFPDIPGAKKKKFTRSWKVKDQPRKTCRIPGTG